VKNKTIQKIHEVINDKIGDTDEHFMNIMIVNGLSQMATNMHINIEHFDGTKVPCNAYSVSLAPSGYNKGRLMNILEDNVFNDFREEYEDMFGSVAEANCTAKAEQDAARKGIDFEDAMESILKRWDRLPKPLYSFSDATEAGLKAVREKYTMAGLGGTCMVIDEIAYNLPKFEDVLTSMLEVYDVAKLKDKLIKVDSNGESGRIPATLLMFGSPSSLLNGSKNEDDFIDMLRQGYARRMFFSYIKNYDKNQEESPEDIIRRAKQSKGKESHFSCFKSLANKQWIGATLQPTDEFFIHLLNYKRECEKKAELLKSHQEIQLFELSHRYWKVFKLAGLLSIAECRTSVTMDDLEDAISFAEESGSHFEQIMLREPNYIRLFNYIADVGTKVTEADLYSNLHFYSSSNQGAKKDMRNLAAAHAYNVGGVFKETSKNGVNFYEAELLKETDLNKLILSYSTDITTGYENVAVKYDELGQFVTTDGFHYVAHHLLDGYRKAENATGHINLVVLDVDHECSIELAQAMLKDYKYMLYTTKRHTDKEHRFRIIMPLKYNVKFNAEDYKRFMKNIAEWLPFETDEATFNLSRKWLTNSGTLYKNNGILLDPTNFIPNTQKANETKRNIDDLSNMDSIERFFLMQLNDGGSRNNTIVKLGLMLVDSGFSYESIEDKLISFNEKIDEPLSVKEVMSTVMQTVRKKIAERDA
jgi:hypothetical protein